MLSLFPMISIAILTLNSARTLEKTLQSLSAFNEVLILDTGSQDETVAIAKTFPNVKLHTADFTGFGSLRNKAASLAKNDWILAIDSDEELSPALIEEIKNTGLEQNSVYSFPFINFYNGKMIKCCGWGSESHVRLYNRRKTAFTDASVHERVLVPQNGQLKSFRAPFFHYSMQSIDDFLRKIQKYSSLYAEEHQGQKKSSTFKAVFHGSFAFIKSYFFQKGFLSGKEGFIISFYNGNCSFYKYLKLQEKNQSLLLRKELPMTRNTSSTKDVISSKTNKSINKNQSNRSKINHAANSSISSD